MNDFALAEKQANTAQGVAGSGHAGDTRRGIILNNTNVGRGPSSFPTKPRKRGGLERMVTRFLVAREGKCSVDRCRFTFEEKI
jgi:hypothetical protein